MSEDQDIESEQSEESIGDLLRSAIERRRQADEALGKLAEKVESLGDEDKNPPAEVAKFMQSYKKWKKELVEQARREVDSDATTHFGKQEEEKIVLAKTQIQSGPLSIPSENMKGSHQGVEGTQDKTEEIARAVAYDLINRNN